MLRIAFVLVACGMLSIGCAPTKVVIPDQTIPHQVARETEVWVWAKIKSGELAQVKVRLLEGWWIASPSVVEPAPTTPP